MKTLIGKSILFIGVLIWSTVGTNAFAQTVSVERELPSVFTPGMPVSVSLTIQSTGLSSGLGMTETFPEGWSFISATVNPNRQSGNQVEWFFPSAPQILQLSYSLLPPITDSGIKKFSGRLTYTKGDTFVYDDTKGDALITSYTQGDLEAYDDKDNLVPLTGGMDYDDIDKRKIYLTWHYNGSYKIIDWHITVRRGDGGYFFLANTGDGAIRSYTWNNPDVNMQYQFKVTGIYKEEDGQERYVILDQPGPMGYNLTGGTEIKLKSIANPDDLPVKTAIVTDDLFHSIDLTNGVDVDSPLQQALALKWNPGEGEFSDFHIAVSLDGDNYSYLGNAGSGDLYYYRFDGNGTFSSDKLWRNGPQQGTTYWFRIFAILQSGGFIVMDTGPVTYASESYQTPTPTPPTPPTPTHTPTPEGTPTPTSTPTLTPTPTFNPITVDITIPNLLEGAKPLELVWLPAGSFIMGSILSEQDHVENEAPPHLVTISKEFLMGRYEVTNAQFVVFLNEEGLYSQENVERLQVDDADLTIMYENGHWKPRPGKENYPVGEVSWYGARDFCQWLSSLDQNLDFRLPSEAEWEYACRSGSITRYYWGDDADYAEIPDYAWFADNSQGTTREIGSKLPNHWDLYDMNGNVWEWCRDGYELYTAETQTDPENDEYKSVRMIRGGGFGTQKQLIRSAYRRFDGPYQTWGYLGFRVSATRKN